MDNNFLELFSRLLNNQQKQSVPNPANSYYPNGIEAQGNYNNSQTSQNGDMNTMLPMLLSLLSGNGGMDLASLFKVQQKSPSKIDEQEHKIIADDYLI